MTKGSYSLYIHQSPQGKIYIGITSRNPYTRWGHDGLGYYDKRKSNQSHFYNAIQKYGWNNFQHIILLENLSKEVACECEKYLIVKYKTNDKDYGYNITEGGEGVVGYVHTNETKEYLSRINEGKIIPQEVKDKISNTLSGRPNTWQRGKKKPEEACRKMSNSLKGHIVTQETRYKISEANKGRRPTEETRRKMSEHNCMHNPEVVQRVKETLKKSQKDRTAKRLQTMKERYPDGLKQSTESNKKRSDTLKGRKKSEETKQKMRKPKSPETIENMRKAQKEAWKRRKEKMEDDKL